MVALGPIRSTAIDALSKNPQFDQICGQFFSLFSNYSQLHSPLCSMLAMQVDSAIGNLFDSLNINIEGILEQDDYCCRVDRFLFY